MRVTNRRCCSPYKVKSTLINVCNNKIVNITNRYENIVVLLKYNIKTIFRFSQPMSDHFGLRTDYDLKRHYPRFSSPQPLYVKRVYYRSPYNFPSKRPQHDTKQSLDNNTKIILLHIDETGEASEDKYHSDISTTRQIGIFLPSVLYNSDLIKLILTISIIIIDQR